MSKHPKSSFLHENWVEKDFKRVFALNLLSGILIEHMCMLNKALLEKLSKGYLKNIFINGVLMLLYYVHKFGLKMLGQLLIRRSSMWRFTSSILPSGSRYCILSPSSDSCKFSQYILLITLVNTTEHLIKFFLWCHEISWNSWGAEVAFYLPLFVGLLPDSKCAETEKKSFEIQ